MTAKHAAPYDPARDSATPTRDPKHCYRGKRRGVPSQHDREANPRGLQFCHAHEVRKAALLAEVASLPVPRLRVVEGGAA